MTAKEIILDELSEQTHPVMVEDVIFWALEYYAKTQHKAQWGTIVAQNIIDRILRWEKINESEQ